MAHFDIFTHDLNGSHFGDMRVCLAIGLLISFLAVVVINCLLDQREPQHKSQRSDIGEEKAHFEHIDELTQGDEQIKEIEKVFELVVEDQGQEGQFRVLGVDDEVGFLDVGGVDVSVHVDDSRLGNGSWAGEERLWERNARRCVLRLRG
jgi:hypothetical protein